MIVFDTETEDFLTDLIGQNLDPINEALDLQPSLTFAEYGFKLLFKGLLSSSILDAYSSEVTTRLTLAEHHIYGSSHLGIQYYDPTRTDISSYRDFTNSANDNLGLSIKRPWYSHVYGDIIKSSQKLPWNNWERTVALSSERVVGMKEYALTDHLGNVLVTVLDRKVGHQPVGATQYDYWMADIASAQDYFPYGMLMMNRYTTGNKFRFGFNGIEKTDEVAGIGNHYTALYGEYDPRVVTRWNTDPKPIVGISPYAMFSGNPIKFNDVLLDSIGIKGFKQRKVLKDLNRGLLVDEKNSPYSFNDAGRLVVDDEKFDRLSEKQKEIASPIRELANSNLDVQIVKTDWRAIIPNTGGRTLVNYGGAATIANTGADGYQDMSGNSGVTILWTGKGESFSPNHGEPVIYQTNSTALYHEIGHAFFRFLKLDPKQAGKTIDYENMVRHQSNEMKKEYQHRKYDAAHPDPNIP